MAWEYQFVDQISSSPTVRLDLTADWHVTSETSFGMPELRRAVTSTLLTDGEQYPAAAYGNRAITLVLKPRDSMSGDGFAAALQRLVRELDRPTSILRYRPGTSEPVHFRTFRAGPESVRRSAALAQVTATFFAEPFAIGLKETLPTVTVSGNPAAPSNGLYFDVPSVKGDVETPLHLRLATSTVLRQVLIAVRRRGAPAAAPFVLQAESMAPVTDTALGASTDPAFSGTGQNYLRTTFATNANMIPRATIDPWPAVASDDVRGTYRVFARVRRNTGSDTVNLQLSWGNGVGVDILGDVVALPGAFIDPIYVDLGFVQFPAGQDPVTEGASGDVLPVRGMQLALRAQRATGAGTLDLDFLLFAPADDRLMIATIYPDLGASAQIVDSARTMVYGVGSGGEIRPGVLTQIVGGPPMVSPGQANRIVYLPSILQSSITPGISSTTDVTPYYWPRYMFVRPVTS